jgi:hypothetical protein
MQMQEKVLFDCSYHYLQTIWLWKYKYYFYFYFAVYTCNVIFSVQTDQISRSALGRGGLDPAFYNHGSGLENTKISIFGIH